LILLRRLERRKLDGFIAWTADELSLGEVGFG
jgi:hypothetical protein